MDGSGRARWMEARELDLGYRTSQLRREKALVLLSARLGLRAGEREALLERARGYLEHRGRTQPKEPSAGSTFRNPPGDYAGRLIEAAGLKGWGSGDAQISPLHANFVVNRGKATARDVWQVILQAREAVLKAFGIALELEIELVGEWPTEALEEAYGR